ncbi:N-acetylneuraminate synthase family protein [Fulvivirga ulvae]|uniref:N-acetylneuraminate synthase family protein n=1 Tax=Fulvivirga ulvae TaxID=2904245 RepID=UPI001F1EBA25|nr:N-acetylneuraminate synthase family protein [Fulvivirga ulvae]UII31656.1 N-acetylneuraminate synthase family protein [Fulvivirga ulvae]
MFIIAEIAQAHEGSLGIAHSYIDALSATGVDAVKFQTHIAEAESSSSEPFRVKFSYEDDTRYDYWKRMEFTREQWAGLKKHCEDCGMEFISSPFSVAAVNLLEELGVKRYKIGSGEVTNYLMLKRIALTGKPIILSSGMSNLLELEKTLEFLKPYGNDITLMQCTTAYPTKPTQWGLSGMNDLKELFNLPVGFSDHSSTVYAGLAATALGAEVLEFHVVFDKEMFGPDAKASLTIQETKALVEGVRMIRASLKSSYNKNEVAVYDELKSMFGKSLAVNKDLPAGHTIRFDDLESKKPANKGIAAKDFQKVIGKRLQRDMQQWSFLTFEDLN